MLDKNTTIYEKLEQAKDYCFNDAIFKLTAEGYYLANTKSDGNVYFLKNKKTGYTKIGCSANLEQRMNSFYTVCNKKDLVLLKVIAIPTYFMHRLEKEAHDMFKAKRVHGEWFKLSNEDIEFFCEDYHDEYSYFHYFDINEIVKSDMDRMFNSNSGFIKLLLLNSAEIFNDTELMRLQKENLSLEKLNEILGRIIEIKQWAIDCGLSVEINGKLVLQW